MKKILALILALMMCTFCLVSCGSGDSKDNVADKVVGTDAEETNADTVADTTGDTVADATVSDIQKIKDAGKILVGITDFAPMDYEDENGEWIGFDADMAKAFAEKLGVEAEFVVINWKNKILELDSGMIDCVWNGMTLTDEVKAAMSCSNAYCNNQQIIIVDKDMADDYTTIDDYKSLMFAVESGSAGEAAAKANGLNYIAVDDQAKTLMEIKSGMCDAAIIDSLMAGAMVGEGTAYENLTYTLGLTTEEYGVGFRVGSDLTAEFNAFLAEAIASGQADAIAEAYGVQAALVK